MGDASPNMFDGDANGFIPNIWKICNTSSLTVNDQAFRDIPEAELS
jgi:hypothetical protein